LDHIDGWFAGCQPRDWEGLECQLRELEGKDSVARPGPEVWYRSGRQDVRGRVALWYGAIWCESGTSFEKPSSFDVGVLSVVNVACHGCGMRHLRF
jgi:hypothetical protein